MASRVSTTEMMSKYFETIGYVDNENVGSPKVEVISLSPSPSPSKKKDDKKRKGIVEMIKSKKALENITNGNKKVRSHDSEESKHTDSSSFKNSLSSPSKEQLRKQKSKQLKKHVVLLTERVNALEDNQIALNEHLVEVMKERDTLLEVMKERDTLLEENKVLQDRLSQLESKMDRYSDKKMKDFVNHF